MAHVLLVEDHQTIRSILTACLRLHGHTVTGAPNARTALSEFGAHVDLVVADLEMEGRSGADLLRSLRDEGSTVPAILMSEHFPHAAEVTNADFVLQKPFEPEALIEAVERVVAHGSVKGWEHATGP